MASYPFANINSNSSLSMSLNISNTRLNSTTTKTKVEGCEINYAMNNIKLICENCTKLEREM